MEISHNATSTPTITTNTSDTTIIFSSMLTALHYQLDLIQFYKVDIIIPHFTYEDTEFLEVKQTVQNYSWLS